MARLSPGQGDLGADCLSPDIADAAVGSIAPRPAAAAVEHPDFLAGAKLGQGFCAILRFGAQCSVGYQMANQRLGIVGRDHSAGQRRVRQILAIGMG